MLRLLDRYHFLTSIAAGQSCRTADLRFIHDKVPLDPSVPDATISYLVESCGLSLAAALSVSKNLTLKTVSKKWDSVLSLFGDHGFSQSQVAEMITKYPQLLSRKPEKTIKPKLDFFLSVGCSRADIGKFVVPYTIVHGVSLEKRIKPNYDRLKNILGTDSRAMRAFGNASNLLRVNLDKRLMPNIKTLQDIGVSEHSICRMLTLYPDSLLKDVAQFDKVVNSLVKMGFDSSKALFILGVSVLVRVSQATMDRKSELYRSLGWSDEDIRTAFKKHPFCMITSDEKIKQNANFFLKELKWTSSFIACRSNCLFFNFRNTILPRYKIFQILASKDINRKLRFSTFLLVPKTKFFDKYVLTYADKVPELLEVYKYEFNCQS